MTIPYFDAKLSDNQFGLPDPVVTKQGQGATGLEYQIVGTTVQSLILRLSSGQIVYTESGGIGWMSPNIAMNTGTGEGGIGGVFKRVISGSSIFLVEYSTQDDEGMVAFTSSFPGRIVPIHLEEGQSTIIQKKRFLCAESSIKLDIYLQKTLSTSLLGGIDFIMQELSGPGVAFICLDGDTLVYTLAQDQILKADPELVAMYDPTVSLDVEMISGFKNILFSGRKMCQLTLRGPGRIFLQTMAIDKLAKALIPYLPKPSRETRSRVHHTKREQPKRNNKRKKPEDDGQYTILPYE